MNEGPVPTIARRKVRYRANLLAFRFAAILLFALTLFQSEAVLAKEPLLEPVTIQLRWTHQFQFAGYYAAVEKGFYQAEGLNVFLEPLLSGQDRVDPVLEGRAQYGVGDAGILKRRSEGKPLVVAQIFQHSPSVLITRRGWTYALKNKEEIIDLILEKYDPGLGREKLDFEAKVVEQMILPDLVPIGEIRPGRYARIVEIFHRPGLSRSPEVPEGFFYRPGSASADLLTPQERAWLAKNIPIRVGVTDFPPFVIVVEGQKLESLSLAYVVGLTRAFALQEAGVGAHPDLNVRLFDTDIESLLAVEEGRADACIGNLNVGTHLILENGWSNLKVAASSGLEEQVLSFGIRQDWPELRRIIDKGLGGISLEERQAMRNQYLTVRYDHGIRKEEVAKTLSIVGSVFALCVLAAACWSVSLARKVAERTSDSLANKRLSAEIVRRTNTEEALHISRDYLANLTNSMADIVVSVKMPERTIEWVNDSVRTLGYEPGEIIGRTTEFIYARHDDFITMGRWMEASIKAENRKIVTTMMFRRKNGKIFPAEITMSFFEDKGQIVSICIIRDISERKQRERQIGIYQQKLKALASELTKSEERERRRVATELHDHVGQSLAIARLQLASAQRSSSDSSCTLILEEVSRILLEASRQTRHLIFDLSTPAVRELGLHAAIGDWLNEKMPKHGIAVELSDHKDRPGAFPLSEDEAALLFRHTRELLTNIIKHAKADRVKVEVGATADEIHIAVQDNGVGFEAAGAPGHGITNGHFGLFSITESMADLGGSLEINTAPGKGCRAVLRLPVNLDERLPLNAGRKP